jgi:hypothetical protein
VIWCSSERWLAQLGDGFHDRHAPIRGPHFSNEGRSNRKEEMMGTLKALGLALGAVWAISTIVTSGAAAAQFHSSSSNTTVTVASNQVQAFQYESGGEAIECSALGGSGDVSGKQTTAEVTYAPAYSGCKFLTYIPFTVVQIDMNSCDYLLTIGAETSGPVHVKCPTVGGVQKQITITVKVFGTDFCEFYIPEQTPSGVADYANNGSTQIDVTPTLTGIKASRQGNAECGASSSTTGQYTGTVQVTGEITGQQTMTNIQVS